MWEVDLIRFLVSLIGRLGNTGILEMVMGKWLK